MNPNGTALLTRSLLAGAAPTRRLRAHLRLRAIPLPGVAPDRLTAQGYQVSAAKASDAAWEGRGLIRRVERVRP